MIKPVVYGYLLRRFIHQGSGPGVSNDRVLVSRFAEREGFCLSQIFVEVTEKPGPALESMIEAAIANEVAGILIPHMGHLGSAREQEALRLRIQARTGVPLICLRARPVSD